MQLGFPSRGTLDAGLRSKVEDRHFNLGIRFIADGIMLRVFGMILSLRTIVRQESLLLDARDVVLGIIIMFGYMLTDMAYSDQFKLPRYRTSRRDAYLFLTLIAVYPCARNGTCSEVIGTESR